MNGLCTGSWQSHVPLALAIVLFCGQAMRSALGASPGDALRVGIIGLDTSHAVKFTSLLNDAPADSPMAGCRVVAAWPPGSPDIASSLARAAEYTAKVEKMGVKLVPGIEELLEAVDVVLLETNDGRPHFMQAAPVLRRRKPLFVDKPVAGSLADVVALYRLAAHYDAPVFSSSALRYAEGPVGIRGGAIGEVTGCDAFSPCPLEATHPDLFWYGIHGVETLFTIMGPGCESVRRVSSETTDVVVGNWSDGRIGTFRGRRRPGGHYAPGYGGTAFGVKGTMPIGGFSGYEPLLAEVVQFFRSGKAPVTPAETIEIYAFMEAADESKRQEGRAVRLETVLAHAEREAEAKLQAFLSEEQSR